MPFFVLPTGFAAETFIGTLVLLCDDTVDKKERISYLQAAFSRSCNLLEGLWRARNDLVIDLDDIEAPNEHVIDVISHFYDLFLSIEDVVLRDAKIDYISRGIILNNLRNLENVATDDVKKFTGRAVIPVLGNLVREVCGRADELQNQPSAIRERVEAAMTFFVTPINAFASVFHPLFAPVLFKTSAVVGTLATKAWLSRGK